MKYLIRLDDACPTMQKQNWDRIEFILDKYDVKPMVGIIPFNEDPLQQLSPEDDLFWVKANNWIKKKWTIALHGYNHVYITKNSGINPLWNRSEFAGISLEIQKDKIAKGVEILREHGINPNFFFAPSHTFDLNTLQALRECSDIRIISDTIATKPYKKHGFIFVPQLGGSCKVMKYPGIWTFCLHPSVMTETAFANLDKFLSNHKDDFISFEDIDYTQIGKKSIVSRLMSCLYFIRRRIRNHIVR